MNKKVYIILSALIILLTALWAVGLADFLLEQRKINDPPQSEVPERSRAEIISACQDRIYFAEQMALAALDENIQAFSSFVEEKKSGSKVFAEEILSLRSKWVLVKSSVMGSNEHEEYIRDLFEQHILSESNLTHQIELAISSSVHRLKEIENSLAVELEEIIEGEAIQVEEIPSIEAHFSQAVSTIADEAEWDGIKTAVKFGASELASYVATQVMIRIGISLGILEVGALNSYWSMGASIVLAIVADYMWDWIDDPSGDLAIEINQSIDELNVKSSTAIYEEMEKVISERTSFWLTYLENRVP